MEGEVTQVALIAALTPPGRISTVAVGSTFCVGVFVGVGGNQTVVGVGVSVGSTVSVAVGEMAVGGEHAVRIKSNNKRVIINHSKTPGRPDLVERYICLLFDIFRCNSNTCFI